MTATVVLDKMVNITKAVEALTKSKVYVGIPAAKTERKAGDGEEVNNAMLGYIHDTGSPANNIPERPFLASGVRTVQSELVEVFHSAGVKAFNGNTAGVMASYQKAGLIAQTAVKKKIVEGPFVPLSDRTLRRRKARGRTGEKPLIDTAQMLNSVSYVIRDR